ncbi:oxidative stress survival, Svf1-like protein [Sodiomyces alkalinus F11]|uniref:Oxidative stress survival, Svf1-like protein n=1 Tax=Sodiomyces alkalinus (strain CBS 110278 / VKM F-3762 / F11) TaxID=1314773 RepID=A0A3N2Q1K0_SODAK|nr:oxidative stress survival, Svf1-like protein [Sodiomyces alkalinus F11]ROT40643.1 oxidative stress survival, Svf1-like protein [Sodiomyces alkalinus F11]
MFNWAKQKLADVAGTQEPIYGPSAIKSVAEEAKDTPHTELTRDLLKWRALGTTNVETQSFYLISESGHVALLQVIYSNVAGIHTTCQFNSKVFYVDRSKPHIWCSTQLHNHDFSEDKTSFYADDCAVELSEDGTSYTIKSMNDERSIVNIKITRTAPGFVAGKTGTSLFGTDLSRPWGFMSHAFWPRCLAEGTITTPDGPIDFKGKAMYAFALQGMKPHHAAATWNFASFHGPTYSAILMEFTTPPSYGTTSVAVGGIVKDGEIVYAGVNNTVTHIKAKADSENDWPEPEEIKFTWSGSTKDGKAVETVLEGALEAHQDRVDVMAEVPGFIKTLVAATAGTKPYIYQYMPCQKKLTLKLKIGDEEISENGDLFSEATFISPTQ